MSRGISRGSTHGVLVTHQKVHCQGKALCLESLLFALSLFLLNTMRVFVYIYYEEDKTISLRFFYRTDFILHLVPENVNTTFNQRKYFSSPIFFHTRWFLCSLIFIKKRSCPPLPAFFFKSYPSLAYLLNQYTAAELLHEYKLKPHSYFSYLCTCGTYVTILVDLVDWTVQSTCTDAASGTGCLLCVTCFSYDISATLYAAFLWTFL